MFECNTGTLLMFFECMRLHINAVNVMQQQSMPQMFKFVAHAANSRQAYVMKQQD